MAVFISAMSEATSRSTVATSLWSEAMARAFRLCLRKSTWSANARRTGYSALGPAHRGDELVVVALGLFELHAAGAAQIVAGILPQLAFPFAEERLGHVVHRVDAVADGFRA